MITRGIKHEVDNWINHMTSQYCPYNEGAVQLAMRPVQFWEVVFPKESLPKVLKTINWQGKHRDELDWKANFLRKRMKLKQLPKLDLAAVQPWLVPGQYAACIPIGIKEDALWEEGPLVGKEQL